MASSQVRLFPDWPTILWTMANLVILLLILAALVLGIIFAVRVSRRLKQIEDRLDQQDK